MPQSGTSRLGKALFIGLLLGLLWAPAAAQIYVSPQGDDLNSGTIGQPYKTITKAHSVAVAGDTIYLRGGTYDSLLTTITLSKSGTPTSRFHLIAYPGERPLLDFSLMAVNSSNRGVRVSGNYWTIKGIDIKGAGDNGMHVSSGYNIIEFCSFFENRDSGLQLSNGAASNQIINCDSYYNSDTSYENADGFAVKLDVGSGNVFIGCRSWQNADDGWDGYLRPSDNISTTYQNCWSFMNGYLKNGNTSLPNGDGNGFKLGGGDNGNADSLRHNALVENCLAFDNRVKGFDQNNNRGSMTLYNCTAYRNGTNFSLAAAVKSGETVTLANCVALGSTGSIWGGAVQLTNGWMPQFTVATDDFVSIDTAGVRGPRKPDGSLPDITFMHLAAGSDLINAGTDVGLPYNGTAPDLGAFETGPISFVASGPTMPGTFAVKGNYPNPFNPSTTIVYEIPEPGSITIRIYDLMGRVIRELSNDHFMPGRYQIMWDGRDARSVPVASGIYFASLSLGSNRSVLKMQLLK